MSFYEEKIEAKYPNLRPTKVFITLMADLIEVMTSRFPGEALRPGSEKAVVLDRVLQFLDAWEVHAGRLGFLSTSTAEGLRVSLHATKDLLKYQTEKVGFSFLMTCRLSQDCLERCFGIVRQSCGANDHPMPAQFIVIMRCLAFYGLARSPVGGNVAPDMLESLLSMEEALQDDDEEACHLEEPSASAEAVVDHLAYVTQHSDARLVYYVAGYVARKRILPSSCELSKSLCLVTNTTAPDGSALLGEDVTEHPPTLQQASQSQSSTQDYRVPVAVTRAGRKVFALQRFVLVVFQQRRWMQQTPVLLQVTLCTISSIINSQAVVLYIDVVSQYFVLADIQATRLTKVLASHMSAMVLLMLTQPQEPEPQCTR
ncbi:hypothetical protein HPB47_006659 [Ixodes persulcatus]|uniref:Uncharacterized protein n=1 Tax=Ixodes persulcatus TaxID=34615 RepID=A0AC60P9Q4_IXOPE|nr:hypothetical protein HPB47_006659 [Ixodes persulcatus]